MRTTQRVVGTWRAAHTKAQSNDGAQRVLRTIFRHDFVDFFENRHI
jgi:hypothetical protein